MFLVLHRLLQADHYFDFLGVNTFFREGVKIVCFACFSRHPQKTTLTQNKIQKPETYFQVMASEKEKTKGEDLFVRKEKV